MYAAFKHRGEKNPDEEHDAQTEEEHEIEEQLLLHGGKGGAQFDIERRYVVRLEGAAIDHRYRRKLTQGQHEASADGFSTDTTNALVCKERKVANDDKKHEVRGE